MSVGGSFDYHKRVFEHSTMLEKESFKGLCFAFVMLSNCKYQVQHSICQTTILNSATVEYK